MAISPTPEEPVVSSASASTCRSPTGEMEKMKNTKAKVPKSVAERIFRFREKGLTMRQCAEASTAAGYKMTKSSVHRLFHRNYAPKKYHPHGIATEVYSDLKSIIERLYKADKEQTTAEIIKKVEAELNMKVSTYQVGRIRDELGLCCEATDYGASVRAENMPKRVAWCTEMLATGERFRRHVFTAEAYVQMCRGSHAVFVMPLNGKDRIKSKPKHAIKITVWGGISMEGPTPLTILPDNSRIDSVAYQGILEKGYLAWSRSTFGDAAVLVQDHAPRHTAKETRRYLECAAVIAFVKTEKWPDESPDLNPMELIWAHLKTWLRTEWKPENRDHLIEGVNQWWSTALTKELCRESISRIFPQMAKVIELHGAPAPFRFVKEEE